MYLSTCKQAGRVWKHICAQEASDRHKPPMSPAPCQAQGATRAHSADIPWLCLPYSARG